MIMILKSIVRIVTALSRSERIVRMNMKQYVRSAENVLCSVLYAEMFSAIPATGTTKTTANVTVSKGAVIVNGTRTFPEPAVTVTASTGRILLTVTLYVTSGRGKKMNEKLKSCPFCGDTPYNSTSITTNGVVLKIGCGNCEMFLKEFVTIGLGFDEFEKANEKLIRKWNRRVENEQTGG